ncbi:MAG: Tfx family DNA-binding protein [Candidatus Hadarchaeales archaeon]
MVDISKTHLTRRQLEVLMMRNRGMSISRIASELGTSRSNVGALIKKAKENVEKSKNTLRLVKTLNWPVKVEFPRGTNVYHACEEIFRMADKRGIKISCNYSDLVRRITETLGREYLERRKALRNFTVMVSQKGGVEII